MQPSSQRKQSDSMVCLETALVTTQPNKVRQAMSIMAKWTKQ